MAGSTSSGVRMPKSIDDPDQILLWSLDEFVFVAVLFGLGITFHQLALSIGCIVVFLKLYRRYRDGRPNGFLSHVLYWYGFAGQETVTIRNPFIRRFLP